MIIDKVDATLKPRIEGLSIGVVTAPTLMKSLEDKVRLAKIVLSLR